MSELNLNQFFNASFVSESNIHKSLGEDFSLCNHDTIVFRWADFDETCETIKQKMESDSVLRHDFETRKSNIRKLQLIPVWIKTSNKIYQTTMFDLYERYLLNHTKIISGVESFGKLDISFISGTGPFKSLALTECFNQNTYRDFIVIYLLEGKLPRREYRVRLKCKLLFECGKDFGHAELVQLEQLTSKGMLFSMDSEIYSKTLSKEDKIRILINTDVLRSACGSSLTDVKESLSQYAFNLMYTSKKNDSVECSSNNFLVQTSFDFVKDKKIYLFLSYDTVAKANQQVANDLQNFIGHTKELIREHFIGEKRKTKSKAKTA